MVKALVVIPVVKNRVAFIERHGITRGARRSIVKVAEGAPLRHGKPHNYETTATRPPVIAAK